MQIKLTKGSGRNMCRGGLCTERRIPKDKPTMELFTYSNSRFDGTGYMCIDCFEKLFLPQLKQFMKDCETIKSTDKNVALLNMKSDNEVIKEHCERVLKGEVEK